MKSFTKHTGIVAAMDRVNVDTDQIIPKQFLKRVERSGFGEYLFFDWRQNDDGSENPEFELNRPEFRGASILLARDNFGCGSSREHAPWALEDYGFRVIVAPSFADIFFNNCFKNSMLPVVLPSDVIDDLFAKVSNRPGYELTVDLATCEIADESGWTQGFEVDDFRRKCLLEGLDDIGLTLQHVDRIAAYEQSHGIG